MCLAMQSTSKEVSDGHVTLHVVVLMKKQTFIQYQQEHPYYAQVEWKKIPSY